ncbi:uncharacterized protein FOMMEDRAFT_139881 [Fomitiporia mediterranea MF3/22]|uniref:uncharacterized protein n=1 Tax=Fomitiporia mediterranea (strain MF3/22) TaxID=694068 RepID=UPI0004407EAD|nr:uncharacterized protein FOMMEDRAFT_139881 [Fomitiporia mediterranea MF3/22]EJD03720.1 hypothetical protein FOMMEDRAFT_139881 [Fomitiporia mediterranea MF3/22]
MLARLSRTYSQLAVDLSWNGPSPSHGYGDEEAECSGDSLLPPEVDALSQLSLFVPENALETMTGACKRVFNPLRQYVGSALHDDVEKLVTTLYKADPALSADSWEDEDENEDIYVIPFPPSESESASSSTCVPVRGAEPVKETCVEDPSQPRCRGVRDVPVSPAPQRMPPIPRIVITPAPPIRRPDMSCRVPVQDTSFGARLTVPTHSALNASHPPMLAPSFPLAPMHITVRGWTYRQGHWCAVALGLDEQERRGIFSRPVSARRRAAMRKRAAAATRDAATTVSYHQNMFARKKRDP